MTVFKADLHLHTDFDPDTGRWHGANPEVMATSVVMSGIDIAAVTQHNKIDSRNLEFRDQVSELSRVVHRDISSLLGVEFTIEVDGNKCHVGYLYEKPIDSFHLGNLPPLYGTYFDYKTWEEYRHEYPGVAILNHPFIPTNGHGINPDKSMELVQNGAVDGVEIINGAVLDRRARLSTITDTMRFFKKIADQGIHIAPIAASDAHEPLVVGKVVTTFSGNTHGDFFDAIRKKQTKAKVNRGKYSQAAIKHMAEEVDGMERYIDFS